jgi:serine/threonine protein kinase
MSDKASQDDSGWGTVHYMAPEAFEGVITKQADVYAFGVCLWQVGFGRDLLLEAMPY